MGWLSVINGVLKLLNWATARLQQHHDELNGRNSERLEAANETLEVVKAVNAPISPGYSDELWNANKDKFSQPVVTGESDGE